MAIKDFYRGNTVKYNLTFTKASDNSAIDISGWLIFLSFKSEATDSDANAIIQKVFTMPTDATSASGVANLVLTTEDTDNFTEAGSYFYGFKRVIPGSPPDVYTLETGKVKVMLPGADINVEHADIPDVTDVADAAGQTVLLNAGFTIGTSTTEDSTTIDSGNIIRTDPAAGVYTALGTAVDIVLAT